jgi:hypothetical protein
VLLGMSTIGCLITSTPDFSPPQHTAPFLFASTALPPADEVLIVSGTDPAEKTFTANFVSQDDPSGDFSIVKAVLYIDYGISIEGSDQPYRWAIRSDVLLQQPGSLNQTRQLSVTWNQNPYFVSEGCHTAMLVATHVLDQAGPLCWSCDDDFTSITWQVLRCTGSGSDCQALPLPGDTDGGVCPTAPGQLMAGNSCTALHKKRGATCPETTDGGAP